MCKFLFVTILTIFTQLALSQATPLFFTEEIAVNPLISGTLFQPKKDAKPSNLVILIAGSGPTDRNGNQNGMTNNSLKFLAEELAKNGVAVFSFDKRIIMQIKNGTVDEIKLSFDDMVTDAVSVVNYFNLGKKYKNIIIAGHSEGSLIGMLAAQKNVQGFISIAGVGRPSNEILEEQILKQLPSIKEDLHQKLELLKAGKTFDPKSMNANIAPLFRQSVQPYLISWFKYNPEIEIQKLIMPVLIVNGNKDLQVSVSDAERLKKAKTSAKLHIISNMNHVLKEISSDDAANMASYNSGTTPIIPDLVLKISEFINELR